MPSTDECFEQFSLFAVGLSTSTEIAVVNAISEWTIKREDLGGLVSYDVPICVRLKPDGSWERTLGTCRN